MIREITVVIDTREQYPLFFPEFIHVTHPDNPTRTWPIKVSAKRGTLHLGDYCLDGYETLAVIERKASQLEILKNMTDAKDKARQARAFKRLSEGCKYPYLLLEASPAHLLAPVPGKHPEVAIQMLACAMLKYRLQLVLMPWRGRSAEVRRKIGTFCLHLLVAPVIMRETQDVKVNLL